MEIKYGVTGKDRKALVMAIAEIIGADAIYKGVPTCSYEVDYFTVDKTGMLYVGESIIPCIITHSMLNALSSFSNETVIDNIQIQVSVIKYSET